MTGGDAGGEGDANADTDATAEAAGADTDGDPPLVPEMYRRAFKHTATPALITDESLAIREVNDSGLEFVGYDLEELEGRSPAAISADDSIYGDIVEHLHRGESWQGTFKLLTADGDVVYGQGSTSAIEYDGAVHGYIAVFTDTTKERRYRDASEVLGRLLRHDLRNELNLLYGHILRAEDRIEDPEARESLRQAKDGLAGLSQKADRARHLREGLERSWNSDREPIRLDLLLQDCIIDIDTQYPGVVFDYDPFPAVRVAADDLLLVVIEALLDNAVDHNDAETPRISVGIETDEETVTLRVSDNGPGVPAGQEDLVFGREEVDPLHHGTGISLFFADTVVSSYGGEIWCANTGSDEGATFCLSLPRY